MTSDTATEAKPGLRPIVDYLVMPDENSLEGAYLRGLQCKTCRTVFLYAPTRRYCAVCNGNAEDQFSDVQLSDEGEVWVYTIVHQSWPGIPTPFVGGIIDVGVEGDAEQKVAVRANIVGVEPDPKKVTVGMKVRGKATATHKDKDGNDVVVWQFEPA